jgi:hypothetical protein
VRNSFTKTRREFPQPETSLLLVTLSQMAGSHNGIA